MAGLRKILTLVLISSGLLIWNAKLGLSDPRSEASLIKVESVKKYPGLVYYLKLAVEVDRESGKEKITSLNYHDQDYDPNDKSKIINTLRPFPLKNLMSEEGVTLVKYKKEKVLVVKAQANFDPFWGGEVTVEYNPNVLWKKIGDGKFNMKISLKGQEWVAYNLDDGKAFNYMHLNAGRVGITGICTKWQDQSTGFESGCE